MLEYKSERITVLEMRKHFAWYVKGIPGAAYYKTCIFGAENILQLENIAAEIKQRNI